jgi:hypothetical protein
VTGFPAFFHNIPLWLYHVFLVCSSSGGHLDCFCLLVVVNVGMQTTFQDLNFNFFEKYPEEEEDCWIIWWFYLFIFELPQNCFS